MITQINNAKDAMAALSENFTKLVTGKRKVVEAKEVTNNIGKMINLAKVQVVEKIRVADKTPVEWLLSIEEPGKYLGSVGYKPEGTLSDKF